MTQATPISPWKDATGFLPLLMSTAAIALVLQHVARFGTARQADEGLAAHLWQLLMFSQVFVIGAFAVRWLPRSPKWASAVLLAQLALGALSLAILRHFESLPPR